MLEKHEAGVWWGGTKYGAGVLGSEMGQVLGVGANLLSLLLSLSVAFQTPQRTCVLSTSSSSSLLGVSPAAFFCLSMLRVTKPFSILKTGYVDSNYSRVEGHLSCQLDFDWMSAIHACFLSWTHQGQHSQMG